MTDLDVLKDSGDEDTFDSHRNAPRPSPDCLYGLIGEIARSGSESTEANPYAIAANAIAYLGCAVGRGPYIPVGNTYHHARMFMLHVGRSGRGRKGDAVSLINRIDAAIRQQNEYAAPQVHRGGLSTREGLVHLIHDGYKDGKYEVPAVNDKRLFVAESEFANVLHQSKRDGNTLSPALRDCWDGVCMKPATKTNRLGATDPHISLVAAVTPSELLSLMASRDLTNGFANRFLIFWAERIKIVPFPKATSQEVVNFLAQRILGVLAFCKAERGAEKDRMSIDFSAEARIRYEELYRGELNDNSMGESLTALVERRAPMLLRLAMLFALCDLTTTIQVQHINAALAWVSFSVESVKFVFASGVDELEVVETKAAEKKIVDFLSMNCRVTRSQITVDCFKKHVSKAVIDKALDGLLLCNPPRISVEEDRGGRGRPKKFYQLQAPITTCSSRSPPSEEIKFDDQASCSGQEVLARSEIVRPIRIYRDKDELQQTAQPSINSLNSHNFPALNGY